MTLKSIFLKTNKNYKTIFNFGLKKFPVRYKISGYFPFSRHPAFYVKKNILHSIFTHYFPNSTRQYCLLKFPPISRSIQIRLIII